MLLLPPPKRPGKGNAFEVLGVSPDAGLEEIKQAYLYFARLYHPDVNPDGHDEFARVNQAYTEATSSRRRRSTPSFCAWCSKSRP